MLGLPASLGRSRPARHPVLLGHHGLRPVTRLHLPASGTGAPRPAVNRPTSEREAQEHRIRVRDLRRPGDP